MRYHFLLICLILGFAAQSQQREFGVQAGFNYSRLGIKTDYQEIESAGYTPGASLGIFLIVGEPKAQSNREKNLAPKFFIDGSVCRCSGILDAKRRPGETTFPEQFRYQYRIYRADLAPSFMLGIRQKYRVFIGPSFSTTWFSSRRVKELDENYRSVTGDFKSLTSGFQIGAGMQFNRWLFTARYDRTLSDFGVRFNRADANISYSQIRVVAGFVIAQGHKGRFMQTIYIK